MLALSPQVTFYKAYHTHPVNVAIHMTCVPLILWSAHVIAAAYLPVPSFVPKVHYAINEFLVFDLNSATIAAAAFLGYYYLLDPLAAFLYTPQIVLSTLNAVALSSRPEWVQRAIIVHAVAWIAQFIGHGVFEGRAPALLDNIVGALVMAPFFVHLEVLFFLGYKPTLKRGIENDTGVEITRIRKAEGDKKRAKAAKAE